MMQLLASDGIRSITFIHEQGIDGIKVILDIPYPCQQHILSRDLFGTWKV